MSSEETFPPPPKTPSSPNDSCAVPFYVKKGPSHHLGNLEGSQGPQLTSYRVQKSLSLLRAQIQLVLHRTIIHKLVHKLTLLRRTSLIPSHLPVPGLRLRLQHQRHQHQFREQQRNMDQKTFQLILLRSPVVPLQVPTLQCLQKKHSRHHSSRDNCV